MAKDEALEMFCRREYSRLVGTLTLYCGERDVAEELSQEALMKVVQRWSEVSSMASPGAWVHRVAINMANSFFRRRKAGLRAKLRHLPRADQDYRDPDTADALALRRAVSKLPERQRTALVLRYYADLPAASVAEIMDIQTTSVNSHVSRALSGLRDELDLRLLPKTNEVPGRG